MSSTTKRKKNIKDINFLLKRLIKINNLVEKIVKQYYWLDLNYISQINIGLKYLEKFDYENRVISEQELYGLQLAIYYYFYKKDYEAAKLLIIFKNFIVSGIIKDINKSQIIDEYSDPSLVFKLAPRNKTNGILN